MYLLLVLLLFIPTKQNYCCILLHPSGPDGALTWCPYINAGISHKQQNSQTAHTVYKIFLDSQSDLYVYISAFLLYIITGSVHACLGSLLNNF